MDGRPCWAAARTTGNTNAVRQGRGAPWYGGRTQSTVWEVPNLNAIGGSRTGANTPTGHATQKPVRVFEIPILNHTTAQDAVYDPFRVGHRTDCRRKARAHPRMPWMWRSTWRSPGDAGTPSPADGRPPHPGARPDTPAAARAMTRRRATARRTPARGGQQGYEPPVTRMRRDERILELALERWSQRQIAAEVGLTQGGVSKALRRILTRQLTTLTEEGEAYRLKLVLLAERRARAAREGHARSQADVTTRRQRKVWRRVAGRRPRRSSSSTRSPPRAIRPTWQWNSGPTSSPRSCSACTTPPHSPWARGHRPSIRPPPASASSATSRQTSLSVPMQNSPDLLTRALQNPTLREAELGRRRARDGTDRDVLAWIEATFGVHIPAVACCPGHVAPAKAFCDALRARDSGRVVDHVTWLRGQDVPARAARGRQRHPV